MVSSLMPRRRMLLPGLIFLLVATNGPLHAASLDEVLSGQGARPPSKASSAGGLSLDKVFDGGAAAMADKDKGELLMKTGYEYLKGENGRPKDSSQARQQFIKALKYTSKAAVSLSVNFKENVHLEKLAKAGDPVAMSHLATCYTYGIYGYSRNFAQAEYWAQRRYDAEPEGGAELMQKVQKERQSLRQAKARAEADRRRDEEYRLARQEREWKTEQKRLEKEMKEAEEKMHRDQEHARRQAEADAAAERSAARWRETVNHIQNTGDEIVSDLRQTQRQTNRAIHIAQHQQEEINRQKRKEFERQKRQLEEKQARRRTEYEAEQKRLEDQRREAQQEARRRAERDRKQLAGQNRASQTPSPPDRKAPASPSNQTEQPSSQPPAEQRTQYADLSFSVDGKKSGIGNPLPTTKPPSAMQASQPRLSDQLIPEFDTFLITKTLPAGERTSSSSVSPEWTTIGGFTKLKGILTCTPEKSDSVHSGWRLQLLNEYPGQLVIHYKTEIQAANKFIYSSYASANTKTATLNAGAQQSVIDLPLSLTNRQCDETAKARIRLTDINLR